MSRNSSETIPTGIKDVTKIEEVELEEKDVQDSSGDSYAPTDGGWDAWGTVFGTTLVSFGTFGFVNAFGAFSDYYNEQYLTSYSATLISMIGAVQVFILYLCECLRTAGAVFDSIGPRYLVPASGVVVVFSLFMLSLTKPGHIYQQFLSQSVLFSLGATFSFFPSMGLMAHWFKSKIPYAIGCLASGASVGGIVIPIMISKLIPRIGFGWTIRILAFITLACFAVGTMTIKQRRPSKPFPKSVSALFDFTAFKDPCYLFLVLGCWFTVFAVFNPFFYVDLSAEVANPSSNVNGYYLSILCAASIFGRVSPGLIAGKVGRFNILYISTLISSILILALWYTSFAQENLIAFAALYGMFCGPFFSVTPSCVAEISPIERVGARIGGTYAFMASATLAGTPISGLFIKEQTRDNFDKLILFSGIMSLVGTALLLVSRLIRNRNLFAVA
ncbi:major facilitator superfamily domain-containing protein [Lentinula edodes]|uniref:major facilitator superfamily domain-containing protein n=1 Tax=Lentinula edodes TaxID=5353 RepID=UPI001E8E2954|nr:major facilitator superfamily domain-containing protein [Lentinula edodes]KAH7878782.1 major facilitator superfamily domain-containing protein [Lentinula edodes]